MIVMTNRLEELMNELKKRNAETYYHNIRVKNYTNRFLFVMNDEGVTSYTPFEIDCICKGAILHDIGKLYVKNYTLTKDMKLNDEERDEMKTHPKLGYDAIIEELTENEKEFVGNICLYHHERIDGKGYFGKSDIPLYVQIVALSDVFDALTMDRVYHEAYSVAEALDMIENNQCGMFDGELIKYLKKAVCEGDEI